MSLALMIGILSFSGLEICAELPSAQEYIEAELMAMSEKIDISNYFISPYELASILKQVIKRSSWMFFVDGSFAYDVNSQGNIKNLYPRYVMSGQDRANAFEFCETELEKILFYMPDGMNEFDKALYLHDYICMNFDYDEKCENGDMYLMLKNKVGTCQGYTYLFLELARRVNLECDVVYSDSMRHIWNALKIDGEWYHIDLTWDDVGSFGKVLHKRFLFSDREASESGYYGYTVGNGVFCDSEKYSDEYLNNINTAMAYVDGRWYLADNAPQVRGIVIYNEENDTGEKIAQIDSYWQSGDGKIYANCFSSAVSVGGEVYFNTKNKIYKYLGGECEEIYSAPDKRQIYYLATDGKNICFSLFYDAKEIESIVIESDGDIDGDGKTTLLDIVRLSLSVENNSFLLVDNFCADTSGDAVIDKQDIKILRDMLMQCKIDKTPNI